MARQPRPPGGGGRRSLGEKGLLPTGPTAPTRGGRATPQGVFKPPRRDALGTWTGCGGQARRGGTGPQAATDSTPIPATANPAGHEPRHCRPVTEPGPPGAATGPHRHPTPPSSDSLPPKSHRGGPDPSRFRDTPDRLPPPRPSPHPRTRPLSPQRARGLRREAGHKRAGRARGGAEAEEGEEPDPGPRPGGRGPVGRERHGVGGQGRHGRPTDRGGTVQGWRREAADGGHPT